MFILDVACYRGEACAVPFSSEICFLASFFFYFFALPHKNHSAYEKKKTTLCLWLTQHYCVSFSFAFSF